MTSVEALLLLLGILMVAAAAATYRATRSSWLVIGVVLAFTLAAFKLGLIV